MHIYNHLQVVYVSGPCRYMPCMCVRIRTHVFSHTYAYITVSRRIIDVRELPCKTHLHVYTHVQTDRPSLLTDRQTFVEEKADTHTFINAYIHTYGPADGQIDRPLLFICATTMVNKLRLHGRYTHVHACISTYIHVYIHAYIHTYIHTYVQIFAPEMCHGDGESKYFFVYSMRMKLLESDSCMQTCQLISRYVCVCICVCVCMYMYIRRYFHSRGMYTYIFIYIYIYIYVYVYEKRSVYSIGKVIPVCVCVCIYILIWHNCMRV
jgi:hypothetical protein